MSLSVLDILEESSDELPSFSDLNKDKSLPNKSKAINKEDVTCISSDEDEDEVIEISSEEALPNKPTYEDETISSTSIQVPEPTCSNNNIKVGLRTFIPSIVTAPSRGRTPISYKPYV